jgi:diguanylate cyclase (GGDEF)-like protein/PAS domain S-box-containing protein
MKNLFTAGYARVLCSPRSGIVIAGLLLPLLCFLVLKQISALLVPVLLALTIMLTGLLAWAMRTTERGDAKAAAAILALNMQQQETDSNAQSMAAANALMAQASGRFQELFQGLPAACVCFDKHGSIMEWNRAFEQLYALPIVLGASVWETVYAQQENSEITDAVAAVLEGQRREGIERTYRRPDGTAAHLHCSIFPLRGVDGEITGAISADIDISAQQQAEDALRRSEERMHTLYNMTSQQELSFEEKTIQLLTLGAEQFELTVGVLAQVQQERYRVLQAVSPGGIITAGAEMRVCDTYCAEALRLADTVSFEEAGTTERRDAAPYQSFGLEAYLGTPVRVNGVVWGTLCFAGFQPHPRLFTSGDRELMRLMAQWIGGEVARRQAEEAIKDSEERFRTAIASISEGLIVLDAEGVVTLWNDSAEQILGMTRTEMHGLRPVNPEFAAVREDGTKFPQGSYPLMASLRRGIPQHDVVMGLPRQAEQGGKFQGEMLWVSVNSKPLFQSGAAEPYAVVATFADISERRRSADQISRQIVQITEYAAVLEQQKDQLEEANRQLETLALHDSLTSLGNRRAFEHRIVQEMNQARRYGTPLSVLLLDVDEFKSYNDSFGHPAGDEVLRRLAAVIRSDGRETDFFARYGGEEFIVILPLTDVEGAMVLAERLRIAVQQTAWPQRGVTISLGAATLLPVMPDEAALVSAADQALYAAKTAGRNCVTHALSLLRTEAPTELPVLAAA